MPKGRNTSGKAQNGCMMLQARLETSLSLRDFKGATGLSIYDQLARQKGQVWSGQDSRYFPRNREVRPQSRGPVFIDAGRHGVSSTRCSSPCGELVPAPAHQTCNRSPAALECDSATSHLVSVLPFCSSAGRSLWSPVYFMCLSPSIRSSAGKRVESGVHMIQNDFFKADRRSHGDAQEQEYIGEGTERLHDAASTVGDLTLPPGLQRCNRSLHL